MVDVDGNDCNFGFDRSGADLGDRRWTAKSDEATKHHEAAGDLGDIPGCPLHHVFIIQ